MEHITLALGMYACCLGASVLVIVTLVYCDDEGGGEEGEKEMQQLGDTSLCEDSDDG